MRGCGITNDTSQSPALFWHSKRQVETDEEGVATKNARYFEGFEGYRTLQSL